MLELLGLIGWGMIPLVGFFMICYSAWLILKKKGRMYKQKITEALEEILQAACDHAFIESSYSEGDYDIDIHKDGEAKIKTILEGM